MFIMGLSACGLQICFVYFIEFLTEKKSKQYGAFINAGQLIPQIMATVTFQFITRYALFFLIFSLLLTILAALIAFCLIPESPKFLINKGNDVEA